MRVGFTAMGLMAAVAAAGCVGSEKAVEPETTATPPMGWNSWNSFGITVAEEQVKANADYMAEQLAPYGWECVVVDLGWYLPPEITTATFKMDRPPEPR